MSKLTRFLKNNETNLREDVGERSIDSDSPVASPVTGRTRMKNACRLSIDRIVCDPQHREEFTEESITRLAGSIKQHGQLQPIRVRWDESRDLYVVIAGERRLRATREAELTEIDCVIVEEDLTESEILTQQLLENLQREDLKPVERARGFRDLMEKNEWDAKKLSSELHVSNATVSNALRLLSLDVDTQDQVDSGKLAAKIAIAATRKSRSKAKPPRPKTIRTTAGKILLEPKAGRSYEEVLRLALDSFQVAQRRAA